MADELVYFVENVCVTMVMQGIGHGEDNFYTPSASLERIQFRLRGFQSGFIRVACTDSILPCLFSL